MAVQSYLRELWLEVCDYLDKQIYLNIINSLSRFLDTTVHYTEHVAVDFDELC